MRLAFAGTPEFARVVLEQLHAAGHEVVLVLTQPDRPAGRGMKLQPSPVKAFAQAHGLSVCQPRSLRLDGKFPEDAANARDLLAMAKAQALVVVAYGLILPQWVLDCFAAETGSVQGALPRLGCLNVHASLLPRWRGAAPIQRAIEAGDAQTGVTIMQMDAGLDTGDMLLADRLTISEHDTSASLHDRLAQMGARLILQVLAESATHGLAAKPQPEAGVTYAHKIDKREAAIDWQQPAEQIERRIRAFDPFPGSLTQLGQEPVKVWLAQVEGAALADACAGQVLSVDSQGIDVATGQGVLRLLELQRAGGKRLPVREFLRGFEILPGQVFTLPEANRAG